MMSAIARASAVERTMRWRKSFPREHLDYTLRRLYGITLERYEELIAEQNGLCALCKEHSGVRRLSVDHNHVTGVVRGLLCHKCNRALGYFRDDPERLMDAIRYLRAEETAI